MEVISLGIPMVMRFADYRRVSQGTEDDGIHSESAASDTLFKSGAFALKDHPHDQDLRAFVAILADTYGKIDKAPDDLAASIARAETTPAEHAVTSILGLALLLVSTPAPSAVLTRAEAGPARG